MSKFFTAIPVAVEGTAGLLPEGAAIERVKWNPATSQVELYWDHSPFHTGKDYPIEFSAVDLEKKRLPGGVKGKVRDDVEVVPTGGNKNRVRTLVAKGVSARPGTRVKVQVE